LLLLWATGEGARRERCSVDLLIVACARGRDGTMRAALAEIATNVTSKKDKNAVRTIGGTRRNLSTTSVRRGSFDLEC